MITFQQGQFGRRVVRGGESSPIDPYFSSVRLLTSAEGANGSTSLIDVTGKTWTASGATLSTAWAKFGGSSVYFDSVSDKFSTETSIDFAVGSGDFTVECWILPTNISSFFNGVFGSDAATNHWYCGIKFDGALVIGNLGGSLVTSAAGVIATAGANYHVCLQRIGTTLYGHVDGDPVVNTSSPANANQNTARIVRIGAVDGIFTNSFLGYMDEFRFTVGVARYGSGSFSPPTEAFPQA